MELVAMALAVIAVASLLGVALAWVPARTTLLGVIQGLIVGGVILAIYASSPPPRLMALGFLSFALALGAAKWAFRGRERSGGTVEPEAAHGSREGRPDVYGRSGR